jgi:hypothetical protein
MKTLAGILFMYLAGYSLDNSVNQGYSALFFGLAVYFFVSDHLSRK